MQGIDLSIGSENVYTDFNPFRHTRHSHAQDSVIEALQILGTGDESTINEHVLGGLLAGCKVRRFTNAEAVECAEHHSGIGVKRTGNYYLHPTSHRWRVEYETEYDDRALDHFSDLFESCGVVISAISTNRKGKTREATAHVIYDDPRDVETLLAIIDGTWTPGIDVDDQITSIGAEAEELPPVDCYDFDSELVAA